MSNTFGNLLKLSTFGESHGRSIGGIIEGLPSGMPLNLQLIHNELQRRKPGQSDLTSPRKESDQFEIHSGIFEGKTLGTPLAFVIPNTDVKSEDYNNLKNVYRPSHADYTWENKFGFRDHRGGGRSSARETVARVFAGAIAKQMLAPLNIHIQAWVSAIGPHCTSIEPHEPNAIPPEANPLRCPDPNILVKMIEFIQKLKAEGDSTGGIISCRILNTPIGLGEPVYRKLHAELGAAMLGINACKGFEYGMGFQGSAMRGSEVNDEWIKSANGPTTAKNFSGGIQGGISNGAPIYFKVAFKPVATIALPQNTIDRSGNKITLEAKGRHDPCVTPRAVPIVEAMAALVIADFALQQGLISKKWTSEL
jgi:chorismate synthase